MCRNSCLVTATEAQKFIPYIMLYYIWLHIITLYMATYNTIYGYFTNLDVLASVETTCWRKIYI